MRFNFLSAIFFAVLLAACSNEPDHSAPEREAENGGDETDSRLVVYTSRQPHLIEPLFEHFTAETGIEIDYITDSEAPLIERLDAEGERTPADLLMTVDAGNLWYATERGVLQPYSSAALERAIPAHLRAPDGHWYGLSVRARTIVYHPERVDADELSTYEALADERWKGRLCLRTSRKVYNQSLVAMMIEHHGEERTEEVVRRWVGNLAAPPFSSDTQMIEAIAAGQCDVGIANSYYLGRMIAEDPDYPVRLFWANQNTTGVHVNVSGAGITRHAPHPELAARLLEWLASDEAQGDFAGVNLEFPVNGRVERAPVVAPWGDFRPDEANLSIAGRRQAQAVRLMDRAGYR